MVFLAALPEIAAVAGEAGAGAAEAGAAGGVAAGAGEAAGAGGGAAEAAGGGGGWFSRARQAVSDFNDSPTGKTLGTLRGINDVAHVVRGAGHVAGSAMNAAPQAGGDGGVPVSQWA